MEGLSHIPAASKVPLGSPYANRSTTAVNVTRRSVSDLRRKVVTVRPEPARDRAAILAVSSAEVEVVTSSVVVEGSTEQQSVREERREIFDNIAPMYDQVGGRATGPVHVHFFRETKSDRWLTASSVQQKPLLSVSQVTEHALLCDLCAPPCLS